MTGDSISKRLERALSGLVVRAWRIWLADGPAELEISRLRGVWGMALRSLSLSAYEYVFSGRAQVPRYILRPVAEGLEGRAGFEFLLFTRPGEALDRIIWAAWDVASRSGLGKHRRPFRFVAVQPLDQRGEPPAHCASQQPFPLAPL
ncbi:MAG TPA: hypothetical protein EYP56_02590, partial [Planctomycetaceae bacterium]|nr:hypothetical protein [Planctomycetaceae bacterium]